MISTNELSRITQALPFLDQADNEVLRDLQQQAFLARIPAGRDVLLEGERIEAIPILLSGTVRVYEVGETGREITLYRFGQGDSCILSANAILTRQAFPAIAHVEEEVEAVMIPAQAFREWVRRYDLWRDQLFELLSRRLASLLEIVDEVAFQRIDTRVASLLLDRGRADGVVRMTHQEIAAELGSSREVISRTLEEFSRRGVIRLARGLIEVIDRLGLERAV